MLKKITVLVSGGGTNLQAIFDAEKNGIIVNGKVTRVISSKEGVFALERSRKNCVKTAVIPRKNFENQTGFDQALLEKLLEETTDLIVLAGFLSILGGEIISKFRNRIINVHPSLIPAFCGKGFYGLKVHESALNYGVKITGATVHFVNEVADGGAIIMQKAVEILNDDTAEILQEKVMREAEHVILPLATELFCADKISVTNNKTIIIS